MKTKIFISTQTQICTTKSIWTQWREISIFLRIWLKYMRRVKGKQTNNIPFVILKNQRGKINRFNLEIGQFFKPIRIPDSEDLTCGSFNNEHQLYSCGSVEGHMSFIDARTPEVIKSFSNFNSKDKKS